MCGIAVILSGSPSRVSPFAIDRMTEALKHRGPDAQATVRRPRCQMGHTRLSVIDLATGQQPISDPTSRYTLVFNGEIYNYRDLRRSLEAEGVAFCTASDTEVLLEACIHHGHDVVHHLNGQFAFALWDNHEQTLFAARDRFGEKPFYWARTDAGDILIASEIKALLAADALTPTLDQASVDAYLGLFYVPPDRTIYSNIYTLPPGHAAEFSNGNCRSWRYWQPQIGQVQIDETDAIAEISDRLARAVQRQMTADVPVGAFLSGGLDSSTIVALMQTSSSDTISTFAAGFGDLINELPFAREVASCYRTDHHETQMDIDVLSMLDQMMAVYDEPFADSSNIPTYLLSKQARQKTKVVLTGDGGDELFGGYDWYTPLLQSDSQNLLHLHLSSSVAALSDRSQLWGKAPPAASRSLADRFGQHGSKHPMDQVTAFDCSCYLPGDILVKVDRATMAHGLETRAPFLDVDLAEFVLSLPAAMRFGQRPLKPLLRRACAHLWPESIRTRAKQGFGAPVRSWLARPEVDALWRNVARNNGPLAALLPGLKNSIDELRPQRKWTLLCLGQWLETRTQCLHRLRSAS